MGGGEVLLCIDGGCALMDEDVECRHADGNVVVGEVGGLRIAVAVVRRSQDVEHHLGDVAQRGELKLGPVHEDVVGAVAEVELGGAGDLGAIVAGGYYLGPVVVADLGCQAVAFEEAVEGVVGAVDIHMVDGARLAVGKEEVGQAFLSQSPAGVVGVAVVDGEVVGAVMAVAGAGEACGGTVIDGELCLEGAVVLDVG